MTSIKSSYSFVFFGEDIFSLVVLESLVKSSLGLQPLAVIILEPVTLSGERLVAFCKACSIRLIRTSSVKSEEFMSLLDFMDIDLMISAHFQRLLPAPLFSRAKLGALNLHPSLLPSYRGMSPQHWPIILGDTKTGVTVHRVDEGVDTGRILRQVFIPLEPGIYVHELQKKFLHVYRTVMVEAVQSALAGEVGEIQPTYGASYFHKIRAEDMEITLETSKELAWNMVRAFSFPYGGARFADVQIMKAELCDLAVYEQLKKLDFRPGIVQVDNSKYLLLLDGALKIAKWRII